MPNKPWPKLNPLDQALRRAFPTRMTNGTEVNVVIKMQVGFELYNTRPYHNYETWSDGYVVEDGAGNYLASREDLDDAIHAAIAAVEKRRAEPSDG